MSVTSNSIRVHIHKQAEKEAWDCGFAPEAVGVVFADSWKRLRETPGSKLRRLSSTPGHDFRLRIGDCRAVASIVRDSGGMESAFIHDCGPRGDVYERDHFGTRLKAFRNFADASATQSAGEAVARQYRLLDLTVAPQGEVPQASLNFLLQLQQQKFFDEVLPFMPRDRVNEAELVIGHGPPGSGKTLVACDLALEAFLDEHDVEILVPSTGLENEYRRFLKSWDVPQASADGGGVSVWRFPEFFAQHAGIRSPYDRESRVRAWWQETLRDRMFEAVVRRNLPKNGSLTVADIEVRLPVLVDALLEDDDFWSEKGTLLRAKDRMAGVIADFIGVLQGCRGHLLDRLDAVSGAGDSAVLTRGRLAFLAAGVAKPAGPTAESGRRRLTIVDEAQDLAPAEWRALLEMRLAKKVGAGASGGRLVLLGDLDQRVSLVPFHWNDVKAYAIDDLKLPRDRIVESQVDAASYRMRRNIAAFAASAFDKRVTDNAKARRQGTIDFDSLLAGGEVHVAMVDRAALDVADIVGQAGVHPIAGEYFFMIHGTNARASQAPPRDDVFLYSVRSAKGLEADRVVVVHPFAMRPAHRPEPIDADEAIEFYTAVSRARDGVLLVIDEGAASLLQPAREAWDLVQVHRFGSDADGLRKLLEQFRIPLSADEVRGELLRQLGRITTQPGEFGAEEAGRIELILSRLAKTPDDSLVFDLLKAGEQLVAIDRGLFVKVREGARRALNEGRREDAIATLLFAGEVVLAAWCARELPTNGAPGWSVEWLGMVAQDSHWQEWRGRRQGAEGDLAWTPELVERMLYESAAARIRGIAAGASRIDEALDMPRESGDATTAADHLATDARAGAIERITSAVKVAEARLAMKLSAAVAEASKPVADEIGRLEDRINSDGETQ